MRIARSFLGLLVFFAVGIAQATSGGHGASSARFAEQARLAYEPAQWVSLDGERIFFGAGSSLIVAQAGPAPTLRERRLLARWVTDAVAVHDRLYLLDDEGLWVRDLGSPDGPALPVALDPRPAGALRLGRMDDYLVLVEDGVGIRLLQMVFHAHGRSGHRAMPGEVRPVSRLGVDGAFRAVASSLRRVFLATDDGRLLVVDARDPARPLAAGEVDLGLRVVGLAASGDTVYALGEDKLLTVDLSSAPAGRIVDEQPLPGGRSIAAAGRILHVAAGGAGLVTLRDASRARLTVSVTVGNNFFDPASVPIDTGDTVVWEKFTTGLHNVESCDGVGTDPAACGGNVSPDGTWGSGSPTSATFTFSHTFANAGTHRYFCAVHTGFGMNGSVEAAAAAPDPPGVPDGTSGTPLTVGKNDAAGDLLAVSWDDSTCPGAVDHHILFGGGSDLPAMPGGTYTLGGARCDIGTSPFTWDTSAVAVDPSGLLWFLVVADDGVDTEGSWGKYTGGGERSGSGTGGVSGQCGMSIKDLTNTCGQ